MKTNRYSHWTFWIVLLASGGGCQQEEGSRMNLEPVELQEVRALRDFSGDTSARFILATGQIEPLGGIVSVIGAVGDRVESIKVSVGDTVAPEQILGHLAGESIRKAELEVARIQLEEGHTELAAQRALGEAQLEIAKIAVKTQQRRLEEAEAEKIRSMQAGGSLDLLKGRADLELAKLEKLRAAASQAVSPPLVNATSIQQQELVHQAAEAEFQAAQRQLDSAIAVAHLMLESAKQEVVAGDRKLQAVESSVTLQSLEKKVELLEMQANLAVMRSPLAGTVLAVDATVGQPTNGLSLIRIADLSKLVCRAEVPAVDRSAIQDGAVAAISGGGLVRPVRGKVRQIGRLLSTPRLPNPMPGTRNDWNAFQVEVEIDEEDRELASRLIHAKVDVAIQATGIRDTKSN